MRKISLMLITFTALAIVVTQANAIDSVLASSESELASLQLPTNTEVEPSLGTQPQDVEAVEEVEHNLAPEKVELATACEDDCGEPGPGPWGCYDTDPGAAPWVQGRVFIYYYGNLQGSYLDYCLDSGRVYEYYCSSQNTLQGKIFYCGSGCSSGHCN